MCKFIKIFILISSLVSLICGHGMMLDPVGRSSRWRFDDSALVNYNDNELSCGGYANHQIINKGKCGFCGDIYTLPVPRPNEFGGKFGSGVIVKTYKSGDTINVAVLLTTNHRGHFVFDLCNLDVEEESEKCFNKNKLHFNDGQDKYVLPTFTPGWFNTSINLPNGSNCKSCVLRWTYITGNFWGWCDDKVGALGCGPQEYFRACADITII